MEEFTVIIPTLDEEESIEETLDTLLRLYPRIFIIVSDDGSKDKTRELVKRYTEKNKRILLLDREHEPTHGLTASVLDAVRFVQTDFFVVMDGDLQHPPEKIKEMSEKLKEGADVAVGTRRNLPKQWKMSRKMISKAANLLGRAKLLISGCYTEDPASGFFAGKTGLLKHAIRTNNDRFVKEGFKVLIDFLKTLPRNSDVKEVYYTFQLRKSGKSKIGPRHIVGYLKSLIT
jgi:dolichol-phosphate mannosyltransferase